MKTLTQYIVEKLIINRNYKNVDDIESMFNDIEFEHCEDEELGTSDDIFSMMVDYIRDNNVRSFTDFDSYQKSAKEDNDVCFAVFNKRIKEIDIFQKTTDYVYDDLVIWQRSGLELYQFEKYAMRSSSMHVLKNSNTWNNKDDVEYYEISKDTYEGISKLYDKLIKK